MSAGVGGRCFVLVEEMAVRVGDCVAGREDRSAGVAESDLDLGEIHGLEVHSSLEVEVHTVGNQDPVRSHLVAGAQSLDRIAEVDSILGIVEDAEDSQVAEAGRETGCDLEVGLEEVFVQVWVETKSSNKSQS